MIAPSFLLRGLMFVVSAVVIIGGIAVIWFVLLYAVKKAIDFIEYSNRDFFMSLRDNWPFSAIIRRRNAKRASKNAEGDVQ